MGFKGQPPVTLRTKKGPSQETLAAKCRIHQDRVINKLIYWLGQEESPAASLKAAEILLERGFGKPVQPVQETTDHAALDHLALDSVSYRELAVYERNLTRLLGHSKDSPISEGQSDAMIAPEETEEDEAA